MRADAAASRRLPDLTLVRGWRAWALACGLGGLAALALPPLCLIPVLLVAVPGLLALIEGRTSVWGAAGIGFWFGLGYHVVGLYWITEAIMVEAARYWWLVPFAVPLLSAGLALFVAAACAAAWLRPPGLRRVLLLVAAWILAELARQFLGTGFPWNPLGSVWAMPGPAGDVMLQPAALVGVHGLTAATLLLAATPSLGRRAMVAGGAVLALWIGYGVWRIGTAPPPTGLTVVLVQGNVAEGQKHDRTLAVSTFERYLALTRAGIADAGGTPAVVIWPETASQFLLDRDANARAAIAEAAAGVPVLAGSLRIDAQGRPRNSLMSVVGAGPVLGMYDKWHLVPFGEFAPSWVPLAVQIVPGGGFAFGDGPATLHVPGLPPFAAMICYEVVFPAQVVDQTDRPAWMVNITNDAWFGNSTGPRQHLAAARLRAVEEGLPLMRAANTGITAAFDAFGREDGRIGMNVQGHMQVQLGAALPATAFARWGLIVPAALAVVLGLLATVPLRLARQEVTFRDV